MPPPQLVQQHLHSVQSEQHLRPVTTATNGNSAVSTSNGSNTAASVQTRSSFKYIKKRSKRGHKVDGHNPISTGEVKCGTDHRAARDSEHGRDNDGSLDICIRVEMDQTDAQGRTESYGLTVPALRVAF